MMDHLTAQARQLARRIHRRLTGPEGTQSGKLFRCLSWAWRRARALHHRLFRRQPPLLIVLDAPPRLSGFAAISGWVMSRSAPVTLVEAIVDGHVLAAVPPTEQRPDAVQRFPHYRFHGPIGFRLAPPPGTLTDGQYPLCIRARDARDHTAELHTLLVVNDYRFADTGEMPAHLQGSDREYQFWLRWHSPSSPRRRSPRCRYEPKISIVMPVFRPHPEHLREAIASVQAQRYDRWELCLCDDGSQQPELTRYLEALAARDPRIRWTTHATNRGIAAATNTAIRLGTGEYVAFLDQDDVLTPDALWEVVHVLQAGPADILYSDRGHIDAHGCRVAPFFKPDWSPDLLLSFMYLCHLCVYRRAFLEQVGPCRSEFDSAQDWELALRATAQTERIVHIPKLLYHWRVGGNSAGETLGPLCHERSRQACQEALARQGINAYVIDGPLPCTFHVRYQHPQQPLVSILIPTRDNVRLLQRCLRSICRRTDYPNYEILVIDNGSRTWRTRQFLRSCGQQILRFDIPFNHSRLNNLAARYAQGSLLLLLNDDTEVITSDWLTAMVEHALRPEVGAVGAWLLHPDGRTQHAGILLGTGPVANPLNSGIIRDGLDRSLVRLTRNVSAVTGACLMIRRELYLEMGGLDEDELPTSFNDVDLCLRLRQAGYRIIYTPLARLYHHESASRDFHNEARYIHVMHARWGTKLHRDPFWNPNLPHGSHPPPGLAFHWQKCLSDLPKGWSAVRTVLLNAAGESQSFTAEPSPPGLLGQPERFG